MEDPLNLEVRRSIEHISFLIERLNTLRKNIEKDYEYRDDVDKEIRLRGSLLLYETYVRGIGSLFPDEKYLMKKVTPKSDGNLVIAIDGDWLSHELSRMLGSLTVMHNFFFVDKKLLEKDADYRLIRGAERWDIYRKAKFHFYLRRNEELRIKSLHLASPGVVEFTSVCAPYAAWIISFLIILTKAGKTFDSLITVWKRLKDTLREIRADKRREKVEIAVHSFFMEEFLPGLTSDSYPRSSEIIKQIADGVNRLSKAKLTDPIATTDHLLIAMSILSHLVEANIERSTTSSPNVSEPHVG